MEMKTRNLFLTAALALVLTTLTGCKAPKNVAYFQDYDTVVSAEIQARKALVVRPQDKLQIIVTSKDPALGQLFNLPVISSRLGQTSSAYGKVSSAYSDNTTANSEGLASYTVSPEGNIEFPVLGTLHVAGMTRNELAGFIKGELMAKNLVKDPTVLVEFLNTGVSVLGEVKAPGRYVFNRDQITLLDAVAMAGDLTIQGERENVKVVRREGNVNKIYTIDLTSGKDVFNSPGYYLQQDDIVYIEPNDFQKRTTTANGNQTLTPGFWISIFSALTSTALLVVNLVK